MIYSNNSKPFGFVNIGNDNNIIINKDTFLTKGVYAGKNNNIDQYYIMYPIDNLFQIVQYKSYDGTNPINIFDGFSDNNLKFNYKKIIGCIKYN